MVRLRIRVLFTTFFTGVLALGAILISPAFGAQEASLANFAYTELKKEWVVCKSYLSPPLKSEKKNALDTRLA